MAHRIPLLLLLPSIALGTVPNVTFREHFEISLPNIQLNASVGVAPTFCSVIPDIPGLCSCTAAPGGGNLKCGVNFLGQKNIGIDVDLEPCGTPAKASINVLGKSYSLDTSMGIQSYPIPGLAISIPIIGKIDVEVTAQIAVSGGGLKIYIGLDACGTIILFGKKCGHDLVKALPVKVIDKTWQFGSFCGGSGPSPPPAPPGPGPAPPAPPAPSPAIPSNLGGLNSIVLIGGSNKLCLDVPGGDAGNGKLVQFWSCTGLDNQQWIFTRGAENIRYAPRPDLCLDSGDFNNKAGDQLFLWECNGMPQQKWGYSVSTKSIYLSNSMQDGSRLQIQDASRLQSPLASKCLDSKGMADTPGTAVDVWQCSGQWNQQFWVPPGYAPIVAWSDSSMCIDLEGGKAFNGAKIQVWNCNNLAQQMWWFGADDWKIRWAYDMSYCIDGANYDTEGSHIQLWKCSDASQQKWGFDSESSTIYLADTKPADTKSGSGSGRAKCMDALGGKASPGLQLGTWECNGEKSQQWLVQWYGDGLTTDSSKSLTSESLVV